MKTSIIAAVLAAATLAAPAAAQPAPAPAASQPAPAPAAPATGFSTEHTLISVLLDNPATKAVLDKHIPTLIANPQFEQARPFTLKQIQGYAPDQVPDALLAKIDADLAAIK